MILTGPAIAAAVAAGEITIDPFEPSRLSLNAYDWRLGCTSIQPSGERGCLVFPLCYAKAAHRDCQSCRSRNADEDVRVQHLAAGVGLSAQPHRSR